MASTATIDGSRVAIVTGAAQGIGRAIALRLADDGLDVTVTDLPSQQKELDSLVEEIMTGRKQRALAVVGDVTEEADIQNVVDITVKQLGGLDVMVANAGIARNSPLVETSVDEWEEVQAVNVRGVFLCYKAAAIQMIKQGRGGRIIGASSVAGKKGSANWGPYCASKFAVRGLTQSAGMHAVTTADYIKDLTAAEWGTHGITVNAYAPGLVKTGLWTGVVESRNKHGMADIFPLLTMPFVEVGDIAGLVSYIVRPEAKFITGQTLNINGGVQFD